MLATLTAGTISLLLLISGCQGHDPAPTQRLCTEQNHDAPCQANGDIEPTVPRCYEDEPCWDCRTMGNRVCGIDPQVRCWDQPMPENASDEDPATVWVQECEA